MPMSGQANAVLGALVGLGLGEATNALGLTEAPGSGRSTASAKRSYTNPVNAGAFADYAQSLLAPAPAAPPMGPVQGEGVPSGPVSPNHLVDVLTSPNFEGVDPDKFNTVTGDALQTLKRAETLRAIKDAARVNEVLGQRQISRQQAGQLIRDYYQKHPKINIPIEPYTTEQAAELRGRALLAEKQDEAVAMGLDRNAYTSDPVTGLPVANELYFKKLEMDRRTAEVKRLADAEKERVRLSEAAQTAREEAARAHERRVNANDAYEKMVKSAPERPKKPDDSAPPEEWAQYKQELKDYNDPITGRAAILRAARQQWMLDKGYTPVTAPTPEKTPWANPHTSLPPEQAAEAAGIGFATNPMDGYRLFNPGNHFLDSQGNEHVVPTDPAERAAKMGVPKFNTPEEAQKNLKLGQQFLDSEGNLRKVTRVLPAVPADVTPINGPNLGEQLASKPQAFEEALAKVDQMDADSKAALANVVANQPDVKVAAKKRTRKTK